MNHLLHKIIPILLAAVLLLSVSGCGALKLTEEDMTRLEEDDAEVVIGQSIGQALQATYAADRVFSLNSVSTASFNPYVTTSAWNQVVDMLVYEGLVVLNENYDAVPNLITGWQTEDGINWVFTVDTTRKFHGGGDMTSYDAVYSIQQAMAYGAKYSERFREVSGVSAIDESTFSVTLKEANYRFYQLLNIPCIEYGTAYDTMPPGTGPYAFSESGTYLTLDENYPQASAMPLSAIYLKEYSAAEDILQAFEDSYLDLVINSPTGMASLGYSSTNIIKYVDSTCLQYLGYNMSSTLFSQALYRAVMTYAIDRGSIVSDAMAGAAVAAELPIHPNSELYPEDYAKTLAYSPATFDAAMKNAGVADVDGDGAVEFGGVKYTINFIVCSDSAAKVSAARLIASELQSHGINVNLRELSYEDYVQNLTDGNYDIYYAEVKLCSDWDLSPLLESDGTLNLGGIRDTNLVGYMKSFLASTDDTIETNIAQLYQYIGQNAPITAICFERSEVLYHRGVLSGLNPTQDNVFYDMPSWTVELG